MTALALTGWAITPLPNGDVQVGDMIIPAWKAADLALQIAEAARSTPSSMERRRATRLFLDRLFVGAHLVPVRDLQTRMYDRHVAYREGSRAHVRIGTTVTAWCRRTGKRASGMLIEWHHDDVFGYVTQTVEGWRRVSLPWANIERMSDRLMVEGA